MGVPPQFSSISNDGIFHEINQLLGYPHDLGLTPIPTTAGTTVARRDLEDGHAAPRDSQVAVVVPRYMHYKTIYSTFIY